MTKTKKIIRKKHRDRQRSIVMKESNRKTEIDQHIVEIQNHINILDSQNQLIMNDVLTTIIKEPEAIEYDKELIKDLLKSPVDDKIDLVVKNNEKFKINEKLLIPPLILDKRQIRRQVVESTMVRKFDPPKLEDHNIIAVKCLFNQIENAEAKSTESKVLNINLKEQNRQMYTNNARNNKNNDPFEVSDLQKLFIMMAIKEPPKKDEEDVVFFDKSKTVVKVQDIRENHIKVFNQNTLQTSKVQDCLVINSFKTELSNKEKEIARKVLQKWRNYVSEYSKEMKKGRESTLNNFIEKLEKKRKNLNKLSDPATKAKLQARDYSTYQHRYKVQKHIIALQRAKLEEQNRVIEELKYNKIIEASNQSVDSMRDEIRKTYYELDRQLKPKIKCLSNELKISELEEPALILHCLKVPQFLHRMEKRAKEREERHAMIRERRRQMEEEKKRLKQQEELMKAEMDKEEKVRRINELKDKRRKEKIECIRKKQHAEKIRALTIMADLHYEKNLLNKYGISQFKKLIQIKRANMEKAKEHYKFQLMKNIFLNWMWYTEDICYERNFKAEEMYRKKLLGKAFNSLKQIHHEFILKRQVAEDYYDLYVVQMAFRVYRRAMEVIRRENELKWKKAVIYHNSNLLFKTFMCWRTLPALNALLREQEVRKAKWRQKVLQVVPDYVPPED